MWTSGFGDRRFSSTSGVLPIDSTTSPKRPPQGLFKTGSGAMACRVPVTSESVARLFGPLDKRGGADQVYVRAGPAIFRSEEGLFSKTRLTAILAVLLVGVVALV